MKQVTLYVCPFCHEKITQTVTQHPLEREPIEQVEVEAYLHLIERHPIRCRLDRRVRRAIRTSQPVSELRG